MIGIRRILMTLLVLAFMAVCESRRLTEKNLYARAKASQRKETARSVMCMDEIGCFYSGYSNDYEWVAKQRNRLPASREEIGTEFRFYGPEEEVQVIKSLKFAVPDGFDASLSIKFIIHGYKGGNANWAKKMKDAFQKRERCNVFIVDWSKGAEAFNYNWPAVNTKVVGAETGLFIEELVKAENDIDVSKIHLLGHSLGSHVAGFAGKWVKVKLDRKVGRITGMDPAGPNFRDQPPNKRLDIGDAELVDVIHTNTANYAGSGFGLPEAVGHFDFYPNGGEDQPDCPTALVAFGQEALNYIPIFGREEVADSNEPSPIACSHSRAHELVLASLQDEKCGFAARICLSWDNYESGKCDKNKSVQMGYNADKYKKLINPKESIKLYLKTSKADPYCLDREE